MNSESAGYFGWLNEIDTNKIQPLSSVTGHDLPLRKDEVNEGNINEQILNITKTTLSKIAKLDLSDNDINEVLKSNTKSLN